MTGAGIIADTLRQLGTEIVFSVSGNQVLSLYDALPDAGVRIVHARHESGAAYMAEAWGRLREEPGVCLVTAGPGHTSALTGIANARASESPLLLLSGASPLGQEGWGAFQEIDQAAMARPLCKAAWRVESAGALASCLEAAWTLARSGVPGPVHLDLPVDLLEGEAPEQGGLPAASPWAHTEPAPLALVAADVRRVMELLGGASRPALVVRSSLGRASWRSLLARLDARLPTFVAESPRGLNDPLWGEGSGALQSADALLVVGPLDFAVGFASLPGKPRLAQVSSRFSEIDAPRVSDVSLHADERALLEALAPLLEKALPARQVQLPTSPGGDEELPLHPLAICEELRPLLSPRDLLVIDGGEVGQWIRAGFRNLPNEQLINGKLGAIGGSIPHAVGAALAAPQRRVIGFLGDGAFGYYSAELDTAVRLGLDLLVVVGNDARWGAEWHGQARRYGPERTFATTLESRPYELVARGYGADGLSARTRDELRKALAAAFRPPRPRVTCLNVHIRSLPIPARM